MPAPRISKVHKMLTHERLLEVLFYNPHSGYFKWRKQLSSTGRKGDIAGCVDTSTGYRVIRVDKTLYSAHRLAWFYVHSAWPLEIDHANRKRDDNRIRNLREALPSQNKANQHAMKNNKLGIRGVSVWRKKYRVALGQNGKQVHIGVFNTLEEAQKAAEEGRKKLHGEFGLTFSPPSSRVT